MIPNKIYSRRNILKAVGASTVGFGVSGSVAAHSNGKTSESDYIEALQVRDEAENDPNGAFKDYLDSKGFVTSVSSKNLKLEKEDENISGQNLDYDEVQFDLTLTQPCDYNYTWVDAYWWHDTSSNFHYGENPNDVVSLTYQEGDYDFSGGTSYAGPHVYSPEDSSKGHTSPEGMAFEYDDAMAGGSHPDEDAINGYCGMRLIKDDLDDRPEQRDIFINYYHHWNDGWITITGVSATGPIIQWGTDTKVGTEGTNIDETEIEHDCDQEEPPNQ